MWSAPVEHVRPVDSGAHRLAQARAFGTIPEWTAPDAISASSSLTLEPRREWCRIGGIRADPLYIGQEHELLCPECRRERAGDAVGVDVVGLSCGVGADRRHDWDQTVAEQPRHDRRVEHLDLADEPESRRRAAPPV